MPLQCRAVSENTIMQRMSGGDAAALFRELLKKDDGLTDVLWTEYPAAERIADHLTDVLFAADETLALLDDERANSLRWIEPSLRRIWDDVNDIMRKITD